MKLAEALILRADLQKRLEQLKARLRNNVLVQEGDDPSEDPDFLLKELSKMENDLADIIVKINRTNSSTDFSDRMTLAEALVRRDALLQRRTFLSEIAAEASFKQDRYSRTDIKFVSTIDVNAKQKEVDLLAKEYRLHDTKKQALNWNVYII